MTNYCQYCTIHHHLRPHGEMIMTKKQQLISFEQRRNLLKTDLMYCCTRFHPHRLTIKDWSLLEKKLFKITNEVELDQFETMLIEKWG